MRDVSRCVSDCADILGYMDKRCSTRKVVFSESFKMRIRKLEHIDDVCDCVTSYCRKHRLLFPVCNTLEKSSEGDRDVIRGYRIVYEYTGDCPECAKAWEEKRMVAEMARRFRAEM